MCFDFLLLFPLGQTLVTVNCITTFEGVYQFTYEVSWGGGGICDTQDSQVKACQDPGSAYVDNEVFFMTYSRCAEVQTSYSQSEYFGSRLTSCVCLFVSLLARDVAW